MNPNYDKLLRKLHELFMLDQEDLDFGIYRIMNFRRDEIKQFIERDLLTQVRAELDLSGQVDRQAIQRKLDAAIKQAQELGVDPESTQKVKDLRAELAQVGEAEALENEVFSQLYNFFSRYYEGGDFVSLRRYKKDVYAIPYEGEEVKLHWANADQYYIKSSEYFKKYRFTLTGDKAVEFTLREASTEQLNNKSTGNTERRFRLVDEDPVEVEGNTLRIFFNYLPVEKSVKREALNKEAHERLINLIPGSFVEALAPLPGKSSYKTLLEKHLNHYTARHSFDYFIHKDLGGFLNRELDFFIKNELLDIDEIDTQVDAREHMASQFAKIVALKKIARKIITFLASLEDFQRSLWLKKKFVTETQYCLTLDRIDPSFYPEIAANERQLDEWVALFKIDQIGHDAADGFFQKTPFSRPLSVKFLSENLQLVLDTAHFSADFKLRLIASLPHLDEQTDGLLIHSDNFQALAFLQERYKDGVDGVYIDPPYNTAASEIIYKNEYKNSSWATLMKNRLDVTYHLMKDTASLCVAIDDFEFNRLRFLIDDIFSSENLLGVVPVRSNPSGRSTQKGFSIAHDYGIFVSKSNRAIVGRLERNENQLARYDEEDEEGYFEWVNFRKHGGTEANRDARPRMFFPFYCIGNSVRVPKISWSEKNSEWEILEKPKEGELIVFPIDSKGEEKRWKWGKESVEKKLIDFESRLDQTGKMGVYFKARMRNEGILPLTWWDNKLYSATEYGTNLLKNIFGSISAFSFPKSLFLVQDSIKVIFPESTGNVLDYFAGSGTTGHATINLNREDNGKRKYILVEQGEYFDTVLLPRIKKVIYSKDWKNGSPQSRDTGVSHCLKYLRLESYEDTLNNLSMERNAAQTLALDRSPDFRETYLLQYLFAAESKASLAGTAAFSNPFDKRLRLLRQNEEREVVVDVVETFNYLLGLVVDSTYEADGFRVVIGKLLPDATGREASILIVWRNCAEKSAEDLNAFFEKQKFSPRDREFDKIYVNGDHTLQNVLDASHAPKVMLIEGEFRRRMFTD
ncbi:MAG: site-specific DNA-methyltransferase [Haliscomenobacter sp.]|uniref:site-specific DNA-methyltransferase n=1 Tax=Haliscomenobacter sp. TaxID=2717303 RepID=UPI0029A31AEF|nr:site-specific DNA-methyltransferase [Haliscomenobacter sp.]MDX2067061.1 site-specific DNA-methyltransferase [Haliscomenobacter sp.]